MNAITNPRKQTHSFREEEGETLAYKNGALVAVIAKPRKELESQYPNVIALIQPKKVNMQDAIMMIINDLIA